ERDFHIRGHEHPVEDSIVHERKLFRNKAPPEPEFECCPVEDVTVGVDMASLIVLWNPNGKYGSVGPQHVATRHDDIWEVRVCDIAEVLKHDLKVIGHQNVVDIEELQDVVAAPQPQEEPKAPWRITEIPGVLWQNDVSDPMMRFDPILRVAVRDQYLVNGDALSSNRLHTSLQYVPSLLEVGSD